MNQSGFQKDRTAYERLVRQKSPRHVVITMAIVDELADWSLQQGLEYARVEKEQATIEFRDSTGRYPVWSAWCSKQSGPDIWIGGRFLEGTPLHAPIGDHLNSLAPEKIGRPKKILALPFPWLQQPSALDELKRVILDVTAYYATL